MSYLSGVASQRPLLRVSAQILLAFCCAAPLVLAFSSFVAYGVHTLLHWAMSRFQLLRPVDFPSGRFPSGPPPTISSWKSNKPGAGNKPTPSNKRPQLRRFNGSCQSRLWPSPSARTSDGFAPSPTAPLRTHNREQQTQHTSPFRWSSPLLLRFRHCGAPARGRIRINDRRPAREQRKALT